MSLTAANKFRSIRDFPELVDYLGDELDWPIETDDFEEMTFEYSAAELGLDEKTAPKFLEIRRLRPLDKDQPWGIFFIRFDDNKLPVVALRRLLSKLVLNKRSTSNSGDRASWHESDLLLISQTGNLGTQSISFAHFAANPKKTDLPILKVLGWDDDDTGLKIDYVIETLREKLIWPDDPTDSDAWRAQWRDAFTLKNREVIQSSKDMAERLGQLALAVRTRLREVLAIESDEGPIHKLMSVFKENLISDLDTDSFSDMYAQTIAYGLLSARIINPKANTADAAHTQIPITNPFLRDLMETFLNVGGRSHSSGVGLDFDELGINEVVDLLDNTNMEAVLRDFGDRNQKEDPVMHFFEGFLQEYDSKIRKDRGVFYTPQPVVSFIVRSVDEQLRTEFELEDGLADTTTWGELAERTADLEIPEGTSPDQAFVQILDPATGTGTFPVEVIDLIYKTMTAKWQKQGNREAQIKEFWNQYVPEHLLPRLHGYELMMAPYAIAHMKIGLKLYETGYRFKSDERARIYLTNALEPAKDFSGTFAFAIPAVAHEAEAANTIKSDQRFTVVIGNPPYSKSSQNSGRWIANLMECYKVTVRAEETQIQALSDDYAKFLRLCHSEIQKTNTGIVAVISNNGFLDGPIFRDMRSSIMSDFNNIHLFNLHGDSRKIATPPVGMSNENVFDIQQGVVISLFTKTGVKTPERSCFYNDVWGSRAGRYLYLDTHSIRLAETKNIYPAAPHFLFIDVNQNLISEFEKGWHLYDIFGTGDRKADNHRAYGAGFVTQQDRFAIAFSKQRLLDNVFDFLNSEISDSELRSKYRFCSTNQWNFEKARDELPAVNVLNSVKKCLYRPFDYRYTVFNKHVCTIMRKRITSQFFDGDNIGLLTTRRVTRLPYNNVFVTSECAEYKVASHDRNTIVFPLWIKDDRLNGSGSLFETKQKSNINPAFLKAVELSLGANAIVTPEKVFFYIYSIFHSTEYRNKYGELLTIDFPRVHIAKDIGLFEELVALGQKLVSLHTMKSPDLKNYGDLKVGTLPANIEKVSYSNNSVWINAAKTVGFRNITEDIWGFQIGGYQVCQKWLKDRLPRNGSPGQKLTEKDAVHYEKILISVKSTIQIMEKIDVSINLRGGWPGAFVIDYQK